MYTHDEINDATGFANGDKFVNDEQVREYFTVQNIRDMFDAGEYDWTQDELDEMASLVIRNRWHYEPIEFDLTTYSDGQCNEFQAIQIPWAVLKAAGFVGDGSDDLIIVTALVASGAPDWVQDASGWVDEIGWGLIGPQI